MLKQAFKDINYMPKYCDCNLTVEDKADSTVNLILYLHCFADAPLIQGYSGYSSSFRFFIDVVKAASILKNEKIKFAYSLAHLSWQSIPVNQSSK